MCQYYRQITRSARGRCAGRAWAPCRSWTSGAEGHHSTQRASTDATGLPLAARHRIPFAVMRSPLWYRVLISLWAVWFSTALIEPAGFFACAMHSGIVAEPASPGVPVAPATDAPHQHHAATVAEPSAPTVDGVAPAAPAAEPTDPEHSGHPCCTCLGQSSTMTAAVVPQADITIAEHLSRQASVAASVVLSHIPLRPAHALPFANGPPTPVRA